MLKGIRVLQFEGLAPSVFCGMYFADQGAQVILVARKDPAPFSMPIEANLMNRGKKCIVLSPKIKQDKRIIQQLIKISDVIIDPYRPGVLQKLDLGPKFIYKINKKAILLRVTGYGQQGSMSMRPGHDLNYISTSGILPIINKNNTSKILQFPTNFLADFASCSLGITASLAALSVSKITGKGRIVDCSMTDGCKYFTKIINQLENQHHQKVQQKKIMFIKQNNSEYCILYEKQNKEQFIKILKQMNKNNKQYFESDSISISKVKLLAQLKDSINSLKNPFSSSETQISSYLPKRDEHGKQIRQQIEKIFNPRPKL